MALTATLAFSSVSCTSDSGSESRPTTASSSRVAVEAVPTTRAPSIGLGDTGDFGGSVTAKITQITPVQATGTRPGEASGPGVAVTFEIDNGSAAPIGLGSVAVNMTDSAGDLAPNINDITAAPFAGMAVEGGKAQATYVFAVPNDARNPVTITLAYSPSSPTLSFAGEIAGS